MRAKLIPAVLRGYNASVIAYGQTGSGKTFTMGSSAERGPSGIIGLTAMQLFASLPDGARCFASFIQVYCEVVHDLLDSTAAGVPTTLQHGCMRKPVASKREVCSAVDVCAVLAHGSANLATSWTEMNTASSRSHAIFTVDVCLAPTEEHVGGLTPKLHFVDLAGSERTKRAGTSGKRLEEGNSINKGLSSLGKVMNALVAGHRHVPYRDSLITWLLEESLGGNSQTLVVACVSPSTADSDETLNTLRYAAQMR